ncbi:MAG: ferrochelatase [Candidatus Competibacteraceae bacterium]|nr:ferrochelatase [Candidatus Competibacteraceae bacterium]
MKQEATFSHEQEPCSGILLANLGTPEQPTAGAVRRYLREFLWDPRVVEVPRLIWWLILNVFILPLRSGQSARRYRMIWSEDGSPLLSITQRQAAAIAERLEAQCGGSVKVVVGMRYGNPSIASALNELREAGARRLLILPLYPQYSATTTASTFDAVAKELRTWRWLPELRMVNHYHDDASYIEAVGESIRASWSETPPGEKLLFSFHGLPRRNLLAGDPYHCECHKTARLIADYLQLGAEDWAVAFQSRFGPAEWLKPYASDLLKEWAKQGTKSVDVVCPGFAADCLETLEEIEQENRQFFLKAGGEQYRYIPALNDDPRHIETLLQIILKHGAGWPELAPDFDRSTAAHAREATQQWAQAMGADR